MIVWSYNALLEEFNNCDILLHAMCMARYIMGIGPWVHHATINAINMAAPNLFIQKRFACIEHICIYLLCTCHTQFYVGVSGGDMQSMEDCVTCNVFEFFTYEVI